MQKLIYAFLFIVGVLVCTITCTQNTKQPYRNIANQDAHYVGMQECKTCHWQMVESFLKTGMGQSWGLATKQKSAANFDVQHSLVYDTINDLYYRPYWDGDSLCIKEYRLQHGDTIHKRIEKVSYIVGSGQHTNSHILNINGYLFQAPITFYTQKGKWDLAPGFEKGRNTRFERKIEAECITCHNGYAAWNEKSLNQYSAVPLGIDCERCHGPGSLHVAEKRNGQIVDTSLTPDYSIVNPRRLTVEQQNNLCQRCHLQGIAVLASGKSFFDFSPSQLLKHTMNVFMPVYSQDENNMIMASHVERMKISACYIQSGKMSCITCHNPHVSVKETPITQYTKACQSCHQNNCTESIEKRKVQQDNCIACHMAKNSSIDIPHVAVTDHYIRTFIKQSKKDEIARFVRMQCYTDDKPDVRTKAKAFIEFYERYLPSKPFLDSAFFYIKKTGVKEHDFDEDLIRIYFLQENFKAILSSAKSVKANSIKDAWTAYRIGEAYLKNNLNREGLAFHKQATTLKPNALDFQNQYTKALIEASSWKDAKQIAQFVINENPKDAIAYFNLGYIADHDNELPLAKHYYTKSIELNPDYKQALVNLSVVLYRLNQKDKIKHLLERALKIDPMDAKVKAMLQDIQ
ncbi:MAG: multiheme c-type cytochrome [Chitinophagaceae bacterium]